MRRLSHFRFCKQHHGSAEMTDGRCCGPEGPIPNRRGTQHARHRTTAPVNSPRCGRRRLLPPRIGTRHGPWLLRGRQQIEPDRCRAHRGGRCRSRSSGSRSPDEEARKRLGDYFVAVLLLDQGTIAAKARCPGPEYLNRCDVWAERREGRLLMDRPDQLLNTAQGALVAGATSDESPPGEDSDGESDRARRGHRADSRAGAARKQLCGG
jgi:hypothetical protein